MKYYKFIFLAVLILVASTIQIMSQCQFDKLEIFIGYTGTSKFLASRGFDTTNIEGLIYALEIDTVDESEATDIATFLALKGRSDAIPKIKQRFMRQWNVRDMFDDPVEYVKALYHLDDPETKNYAHICIDSLLARRYRVQEDVEIKDIVGPMQMLVNLGDYSTYNLFDSLMVFLATNDSTAISDIDESLLEYYGRQPALRNRTFQLLKKILQSPFVENRKGGLDVLGCYRDFSETQQLYRNIAAADPDIELRIDALETLVIVYQDIFVLPYYKELIKYYKDNIKTDWDELKFIGLVNTAGGLNSPLTLDLLLRLQNEIGDVRFTKIPSATKYSLSFKDIIIGSIRDFPPKRENELVLQNIEVLISSLPQTVSLNWLGDQNFTKELTNHLDNAKKHLVKGDSVNCGKEVEKFQEKVNKEYEKTINNEKKNKPKDKRFVTVEGWKFLYYNAQYIIDRLPGEEKKQ